VEGAWHDFLIIRLSRDQIVKSFRPEGGAMQIDFERAFEAIAGAMVRAAKDCSCSTASTEAERNGLIEQGDGKPSQLQVWERSENGNTLRFQWRWYDQSQAFSIQPDMNIMSLELRQGDVVLRRAEERYQD
jgi:hypothetical protein